jgi:hypothetical protein
VDVEIGFGRRLRLSAAVGVSLAVLGLLVTAPAAWSLDAPDGTRRWSVWRNGDKVGDYVLTFSHAGGQLIVENRIDIVERLLAVPVSRYKHVDRQTWQDDRLMALEASTNRDGKKVNLSVRAAAAGLAVDGPEGNFVLLTAIYPSSLWSVEMTKASRLLDVESGRTLTVQITEGAEEPIQVGSQEDVRARHVSVSGDLARELWYGEDGILLRMQYRDADGAPIDLRAATAR